MLDLPPLALVFPGVFVLAAEQCLFALDFDFEATAGSTARLTSVHCVSSGSVASLLWFGRRDEALAQEARDLSLQLPARLASTWCWMHVLAELRTMALAALWRHRAALDGALASGPPLYCYFYERQRQRRRRVRMRTTEEALEGVLRTTSLPFHEGLLHREAWDGIAVTWADLAEDVVLVAPATSDVDVISLAMGLRLPALKAELARRPPGWSCVPSSRLGMAPEFHSRALAFMAWTHAIKRRSP